MILHKCFYTSVIGPFNFRGEYTSGKFVMREMIFETVTAYSFSGTGFIGACAILYILFLFAFHLYSSFLEPVKRDTIIIANREKKNPGTSS